jgi:outer membrane protein W
VFLPTNGTAREYGQSAQLSAGLDYAFAKSASENPLLESVYVDYQGGSKNSGHVQTIGGGVAVRTYLTQPAGTKQSVAPYVGAGIGYYRILFKRTDTDRDATTSSIGGKLLAGVELPQNLFLEANYQFLPSKIGINPSGVGIDAGIRF